MSKPIKNYRFGSVSLAIFENEVEGRDGKKFTAKSFQLTKNYKKGDDWKTTNNYKVGELVNVIQCAQAALNDYYDRINPESTGKTDDTQQVPF